MEPLVAPGEPLTPERFTRYSRQLMLPGFGELAQRRLRAARVLVVGAGGVGSAVVPQLAAAGVGTIGVADDDRVELSNLHRQLSHGIADIGRLKTGSIVDAVRAIDPAVRVVPHAVRLTTDTLPGILADYDLVIDGSDNFPTRYLVNDAAALEGKPLVWGSILQYGGQVSIAWQGRGPTYRDLFPRPPAPEDALSCELGGVLPSLCPTIGALLVTETIKLICGIGDPLLGRVLFYDALTARTREIPYAVAPGAEPVTELVDYDLFCGGADAAPDAHAVSTADLVARLRAGERPVLIDVRESVEVAERGIPDAVHVPLAELELDPDAVARAVGGGPVIVYCEKDPRSRRGADALRARGVDARFLAGGIRSFVELGGEVVRGAAATPEVLT